MVEIYATLLIYNASLRGLLILMDVLQFYQTDRGDCFRYEHREQQSGWYSTQPGADGTATERASGVVPAPDRGAESVRTLQALEPATELPQHRRRGGTDTVPHHAKSNDGPHPQAVLPQGQYLFVLYSVRLLVDL